MVLLTAISSLPQIKLKDHNMSDKEPTHSETALENTDNVVEEAVIIENDSEPEEKPKKVKTGGLWIFSIFNFLLIIAICCAAVWAWYQWQLKLTKRITALKLKHN